MVSKDKKWTDGEVLYAAELNEQILQPLSNLDQTDYDDVSVAGTSYATSKTWDVDAGTISKYIIIKCTILAEGYWGTGGGATITSVQFTIDSGSEFETTAVGGFADSKWESNERKSCIFKYTPTSDEKTNGFTVDIDTKYAKHASGVSSVGGFELWGA